MRSSRGKAWGRMDACGRAGLPTPSASGAETLAPLGAAAAQDGAACRRGHTGTEAVGARPSDLASAGRFMTLSPKFPAGTRLGHAGRRGFGPPSRRRGDNGQALALNMEEATYTPARPASRACCTVAAELRPHVAQARPQKCRPRRPVAPARAKARYVIAALQPAQQKSGQRDHAQIICAHGQKNFW